MSPPRYQPIVAADIPVVELPERAGRVRVIAGHYEGRDGPARTFTDINVWDVALAAGKTATFALPEGHTAMIALLRGALRVNDAHDVRAGQVVQFDRGGSDVRLEASADAAFLVLTGEP